MTLQTKNRSTLAFSFPVLSVLPFLIDLDSLTPSIDDYADGSYVPFWFSDNLLLVSMVNLGNVSLVPACDVSDCENWVVYQGTCDVNTAVMLEDCFYRFMEGET